MWGARESLAGVGSVRPSRRLTRPHPALWASRASSGTRDACACRSSAGRGLLGSSPRVGGWSLPWPRLGSWRWLRLPRLGRRPADVRPASPDPAASHALSFSRQALGSFYFLHESLKNIYQFDFRGEWGSTPPRAGLPTPAGRRPCEGTGGVRARGTYWPSRGGGARGNLASRRPPEVAAAAPSAPVGPDRASGREPVGTGRAQQPHRPRHPGDTQAVSSAPGRTLRERARTARPDRPAAVRRRRLTALRDTADATADAGRSSAQKEKGRLGRREAEPHTRK